MTNRHGQKNRFPSPLLLLLAACLIFFIVFSWVNVNRFDSYAYIHDINIFEQTIYLTVHGDFMENSYAGNHFATHFSPILLAVVPIYALFPSAKTLLLILTAIIATGALALYFFSRDRWNDSWAAALLGLIFLVHPVVHGMALSGFQALKFGIPLFILFFSKALENRITSATLLLLLLLCCREDIAILTSLSGIYFLVFRRQWKLGAVIFCVSVAWFFISSSFVIAHFAGSAPSSVAYLDRLSNALFGVPFSLLFQNAIRDPLAMLAALFDSPLKMAYLPTIFFPLLLTPFLGWTVLWMAAPTVVINLLSNYLGQHLPTTHYSAMLVAVTFVALVVGLDRTWLTNHPKRLRGTLLVVMMACGIGIGAFHSIYSANAACPEEFAWPAFQPAELESLRRIETIVGPTASLASSRSLATHFAKRKKLLHIFYSLEVLQRGRYDFLLLDMRVPSFLPAVEQAPMIAYIQKEYRPAGD